MMECEKVDSVRQAVMKSLGILVAFTDDEDKFNEVMVMGDGDCGDESDGDCGDESDGDCVVMSVISDVLLVVTLSFCIFSLLF